MTEEASRATGAPEDMAKIFRLDGQRAVVTGAAPGLGKAIALGFARFGADVACLDIDLEGARQAATAISGMGRKPVLELEPEEFTEVLDVNLLGVFHCARAFGALMVPNGRGKIINMASIFGLVAMERQSAYASSKGAVVQLTKVLALEFAPHNVQVKALAPAYFTTPLVRQVMEDREWYEDVVRRIPQVGPAVFLASRASSFVTGTSLLVDSGWTAPRARSALLPLDPVQRLALGRRGIRRV